MSNLIQNTSIKQELLDKLPSWCKDFEPDNYYLVLTDDADSIFSCQRLKTLFNLPVGGFYSFEKGLYINSDISDNGWKTPIYVDLSVSDGYAYDNHFSFIKNPDKVNPNVLKRPRYNQKYCGSTLMFLCALYGGVENMDDTLRTILLCTDGFYIGYYKDGGKWRDVNLFWLDQLGLTDYLLPILEKHDKQYFIDFIKEYQLEEKVWINPDGFLQCSAFGVPGIKFELEQEIEKVFVDKYRAMSMHEHGKPIFVSASTYENSYVLNLKIS